jgi:hypothetical protein
MGNRYTGGSYTSASISGMDISFANVVVTGRVKVSGMGITGTILLVPGASVRDSGMDNRLVATNITWAEAAEILRLT